MVVLRSIGPRHECNQGAHRLSSNFSTDQICASAPNGQLLQFSEHDPPFQNRSVFSVQEAKADGPQVGTIISTVNVS